MRKAVVPLLAITVLFANHVAEDLSLQDPQALVTHSRPPYPPDNGLVKEATS